MVDANRLGQIGSRQPAPLMVRPRQVTPMATLRPRAAKPMIVRRPNADDVADTGRSLWDQVSDAFTGIPSGLAHLGGMAVRQITAPVRLVWDVRTGKVAPSDLPGLAGTTIMPWQAEEWGDGQASNYFPITQELSRSMGTTALRIRHPSRYAKAVREGRIVDTVLEDAGNIAMVGGALSKVAGATGRVAEAAAAPRVASGLQRVAGGLEKGARVLDRVSDLPITVPARGARGLVRSGLRTAESFAPDTVGRARAAMTERGVANAGARAARRAQTRVARDLHQVTEMGDLMSDAEQGAAIALLNRVGDVDTRAVGRLRELGVTAPDNLVNETVRQSHVFRDLPEHAYTPEIQATVRSYLDGTLDAESRARIDRGMDVVREKIGEVTDRALNGVGRLKGGLDPQQLGDAPIDSYVLKSLADDFDMPDETIDALAGLREQGHSWDDLAELVPEIQALLDSPDVYPAAWRPAMRTALLANETMPPLGLPVRPQAMLDAGMERPVYMPGGEARMPTPRSLREGKEVARGGYGGLRTVASENQRIANEVAPYTFRALAEKLGDEVSRTEFNRAVYEWADRSATNRVNTVLDTDLLTELRQRADAEAAAQRGSKSQIRDRAQLIFARDMVDALDQAGYEVLQGDLVNPKNGDFNPDASVNLTTLSPDAIALPKGMKQALTQNWVSKDLSKVLRALEATNSYWKRNVLPFSIRWQLGDAIGGMFMSWVGGGIPPWQLIDSMNRLKKLGPDAEAMFTENVVDHPDFVDTGLNAQELQWMRGEAGPNGRPARTRVGAGYDAVRRKSFQVNQSINRFNRHHYVLAKLQRELDSRHLSLEELGGDPDVWADPDVQAAIDAAVEDANKVMGTFDELTPVEQRVIKNLVPFWVWQRHITQLAWRTAVDNPGRMLWTLRIGSYGTQQQEDLPSFMKGGIVIGDSIVPLQWANPFNDVAEGSLISQPGKSLSPLIKLGGAAMGWNFNTMRPYTRPYGSGNTSSDTGGDRWTPMLWPFTEGGFRPGEFAYVAGQMMPLTRAAMDLAPTAEVGGIGLGPHPRYQQGTMMVDSSGRPIDTTNRLVPLAGMVGLPVPRYTLEDARNIRNVGRTRDTVRGFRVRKVTTGLGG